MTGLSLCPRVLSLIYEGSKSFFCMCGEERHLFQRAVISYLLHFLPSLIDNNSFEKGGEYFFKSAEARETCLLVHIK